MNISGKIVHRRISDEMKRLLEKESIRDAYNNCGNLSYKLTP